MHYITSRNVIEKGDKSTRAMLKYKHTSWFAFDLDGNYGGYIITILKALWKTFLISF